MTRRRSGEQPRFSTLRLDRRYGLSVGGAEFAGTEPATLIPKTPSAKVLEPVQGIVHDRTWRRELLDEAPLCYVRDVRAILLV